MDLEFDTNPMNNGAIIKVIGVGGAGNNAVNAYDRRRCLRA